MDLPAAERLPWSREAWRDTLFVLSGAPLQAACWTLLALPWAFWVPERAGSVLSLLLASCAAALALVRPLTRAHRERAWAVLGRDLPVPPARPGGLLRALRAEDPRRDLGRELLYHLVVGPLLGGAAAAVALAWAGGAALATAVFWPPHAALLIAGLTLAGLALLAAAPWLAAGVRRLDVRAMAALLGPDRARELERRVEDLAGKRADVVDAADLERRRIERDLHDGAQQRLVALAMNLGLARETLTDVPEPARRVIVEAHEEAKAALAELRDLIRGLHPAVLADRGLDAALSGVAARVPLPVTLRVDVAERVASTVEAVAYFVVAEALTNVVKHAGAASVEVAVVRDGPTLRVRVADDGAGGADPARGTGLAGLARRVRSVDGTFRVVSPPGGPTALTVELPCAL
ncbi:Oxygen sensor histidine kinase NreB [Actinomadura rubteroloni]|uniref:histidine kinase n=1 Tax=Actinomadura rubteroloni TaxID=1926885 RepID=A0A2P4UCE1_9ACTN|nr:sensor histidine kinase [Actinomadura rubteroloni]POM22710.1 Oxygen sensor histidine kinase NreB [Actinomadura rubteroloni]